MKKIIATTMMALFAASTHATLLATYDIYGTPAATPTPTAVISGAGYTNAVSGASFDKVSTLTWNTSQSNRWATTLWEKSVTSLNSAVNSNNYYLGSVSAVSGKTLAITNITFKSYIAVTNGVNTPTSVAMQLSYDNWATTNQTSATLARNNTSFLQTLSFDFTPDLTGGSNASYRIVAWGNTGESTITSFGFANGSAAKDANSGLVGFGNDLQDFVIQGNVIPEPATVGMLGLGALVTLLIRRMSTK
jgi:hypothetical protein